MSLAKPLDDLLELNVEDRIAMLDRLRSGLDCDLLCSSLLIEEARAIKELTCMTGPPGLVRFFCGSGVH